MKIRIVEGQDEIVVTNNEGKVISTWYKSSMKEVTDFVALAKKRFPNAEIITE